MFPLRPCATSSGKAAPPAKTKLDLEPARGARYNYTVCVYCPPREYPPSMQFDNGLPPEPEDSAVTAERRRLWLSLARWVVAAALFLLYLLLVFVPEFAHANIQVHEFMVLMKKPPVLLSGLFPPIVALSLVAPWPTLRRTTAQLCFVLLFLAALYLLLAVPAPFKYGAGYQPDAAIRACLLGAAWMLASLYPCWELIQSDRVPPETAAAAKHAAQTAEANLREMDVAPGWDHQPPAPPPKPPAANSK